MKNLLLLVLVLPLSNYVSAQHDIDSAAIYSKELRQIQRAYMDSMHNNPRSVYLRERIRALQLKEDSYSAFSMWMQIESVDYSKWNADNTANGFEAMKSPVIGFGMGFTNKSNGFMFDLNFVVVGVPNKIKKGNERLQTHFSSIFQYQFGYDIIKSKAVNLYPYGGLGIKMISIDYSTPSQINASPSGISSIVQSNRSLSETVGGISYQAGIGLEFAFAKKDDDNGAILFFKAGTDRKIGNKSFDIGGYKYNPDFKHGAFIVCVGLKLFNR